MSAPVAAPAALKRTPLYELHRELGAKLIDFGGWEMPVQYAGILEEHRAVRERVGIFDVSHMGEFEVSGPGSLQALQWLTPNDVGTLTDAFGSRPECACRASYSTRLDRARQYKHKLIRGMGMGRNNSALGEARAVDRALRHGLRQRQQFDSWQEVDFDPFGTFGRPECLFFGCHGL